MLDGEAAPKDLRAAWAGLASPKVLVVDDVELPGAASALADVLLPQTEQVTAAGRGRVSSLPRSGGGPAPAGRGPLVRSGAIEAAQVARPEPPEKLGGGLPSAR